MIQLPETWDELVIRFDDGIDVPKVLALLQQAHERAGAPHETVTTTNLVAVYFTQAQFERAHGAIDVAAAMHPSRLLVLIADETVKVDSVTARVSIAPAAGAVSIERIVLTATGRSVRHLESALSGLLLPELPLVVVWGGRPEGTLLRRVLESADRIIIDSGARPPSFLPDVARYVANGAPIGDLAWARIYPWQSAAADALDLPNLREHRGNIQRAKVVCAGGLGAEGLLLGGWIASRVKRIDVELRAEGHARPPDQEEETTGLGTSPLTLGQVQLFQFEAPPATFTFRRDGNLLLADVQGDDDGVCVHRVRMPPDAPGRLLSMELKLLSGIDELYAASVQAGAKLFRQKS